MDTGVAFIIGTKRYHTYRDFGLKQLAELEISPAVPKRHLITNVPGMNGHIDVTEFFGGVKFENRTIKAAFEGQDQDYEEWCSLCRNVENVLHGKYAKIILDIDKNYYWDGFVTVTPSKNAIAYSKMTITCDVHPERYAVSTLS